MRPDNYYNDLTKEERVSLLAPILHKEWIIDSEDDGDGKKSKAIIIHYWAEDDSHAQIIAPKQIAECIVMMQNWLARKYIKMQEFDQKRRKIAEFFQI